MNYKLDDGVEISLPDSKRSYDFDYPFKKMEIGQSFFVPMLAQHFSCRPGKSNSMVFIKKEHIRTQARRYRANISDQFKVIIRSRHMDKHGERGIRAWRVKRELPDVI